MNGLDGSMLEEGCCVITVDTVVITSFLVLRAVACPCSACFMISMLIFLISCFRAFESTVSCY